jgi:hypothetical protein
VNDQDTELQFSDLLKKSEKNKNFLLTMTVRVAIMRAISKGAERRRVQPLLFLYKGGDVYGYSRGFERAGR